jgi:hypothetical protein
MKSGIIEVNDTINGYLDMPEFIKALAKELTTNIPSQDRNKEIFYMYANGQRFYKENTLELKQYHRRLRRAYKKYGMRGVQEFLLCQMFKYEAYGPVRTMLDGQVVLEEKKYIPSAIKNYFESIMTLSSRYMLPNRKVIAA